MYNWCYTVLVVPTSLIPLAEYYNYYFNYIYYVYYDLFTFTFVALKRILLKNYKCKNTYRLRFNEQRLECFIY